METHETDAGSPIRVTVVPSQSSYFAGEQFCATITIKNTRSAGPAHKKPPTSQSHKRASHSISSAPLARPPTSPITPRTPAPTLTLSRSGGGKKVERRGLVGVNVNGLGGSADVERLRRRPPIKSHSLVIMTEDLDVALGPNTADGLLHPTRSATLPLSANHPHARKQSILDGKSQSPYLRPYPSPSTMQFSNSGSASTSTFSLALDPIFEGSPSAFPATPALNSPSNNARSATLPSTEQSHPPDRVARHSDIGLGLPSSAHHPPPRSANSSTFSPPNTELLLWSYAQFVGSLTLAASSDVSPPTVQDRALADLRSSLLGRKAIGGGSMDITSRLHGRMNSRLSHSRSTSLTSNLLSLLSPSPSMPTQPWSPGYRSSSPSILSSFLSPSSSSPLPPNSHGVIGLGIGGVGDSYDDDPEAPLPIFELPPTMLAVDLPLGPGESRSYTYSLPLPQNLPPTFKGRTLRFSYQLIVGTCRAASAPTASSVSVSSGPTTSRIMKIPIRLYNHVEITGHQRPYDLLWPATRRRQNLTAVAAEITAQNAKPAANGHQRENSSYIPRSTADLQHYARRLLASFPDLSKDNLGGPISNEAISPLHDDPSFDKTGCRESIEVLTRNMKRISYDVTKADVKVAVVTFMKSAYRLGETVQGVLECNERSNRARILKFSITLEAHESLPPCLSSQSSSRSLPRVHAEHHCSLSTSCLRFPFALDIPSDASPAFLCDVSGRNEGTGGLEWKIHLRLLVSIASPNARPGFDDLRGKQLEQDGPDGDWGTPWTATKGIAPLERLHKTKSSSSSSLSLWSPTSPLSPTANSWTSYLFSPFFGPAERPYHDGDEEGPGAEENESLHGHRHSFDSGFPGHHDDGFKMDWSEMKVETVECEIPIKVWPGNTEFRPQDVVFDL